MKSSPRLRKVSNEISIFCVHTVFHTQYTHQEDHARDTKNIILSDFTFSLALYPGERCSNYCWTFLWRKSCRSLLSGNYGGMGFSVLWFWLFFRSVFSVFVPENAVFRFCRVVTVVCGFSVLKHLVFGICKKKKKKTGLRIWCPMWFSVFPIWVLVALRSEQQLYHWF